MKRQFVRPSKRSLGRPRVTPHVGDVFEMALDDELRAFGQVVALTPYTNVFVAIFKSVTRLTDAPPPPAAIVADDIDLLLNTMPVELEEGGWRVLGNVTPDYRRIPRPAYIVRTQEGLMVESFDAQRSRPATATEIERLDHRDTYSPGLVRSAVAALHGRKGLDKFADVPVLTAFERVKRLVDELPFERSWDAAPSEAGDGRA